jgi:hypothetical protein
MVEIFVSFAVGLGVGITATYYTLNVRIKSTKQVSQGNSSPNINGNNNNVNR